MKGMVLTWKNISVINYDLFICIRLWWSKRKSRTTKDTKIVYNLNNAKWTVSGVTLKEEFTGDGNKTNTYSK